jgi:GAF domain-containing protein
LTKDGDVLGTFALYSSEPRIPTDAEIELIEGAGHIALIAMERQRSRAALARALEKIKTARPISRQLTNPQGICRYNPGSGFAPIAIAGSNPSHSLR